MTKKQPQPKAKEPKKPKNQDVPQPEPVADLGDDLLRLQAEFVNYRRRSEQDIIRAVSIGKEQAVEALLPTIDNLERAIAHEPDDIKDHKWVVGVSSVAKQLEAQLVKIGLVKIGEVGELFNPDIHNAVSMVDGEGDQEVIIGVAQPGYRLGDNVIRHAMVQVGKK